MVKWNIDIDVVSMHQYSNNTVTTMELAFHQTHIFCGSSRASWGGGGGGGGGAVAVPLFMQNPPQQFANNLPSQSAPGVPCTVLTKSDPTIVDCEPHSQDSHRVHCTHYDMPMHANFILLNVA